MLFDALRHGRLGRVRRRAAALCITTRRPRAAHRSHRIATANVLANSRNRNRSRWTCAPERRQRSATDPLVACPISGAHAALSAPAAYLLRHVRLPTGRRPEACVESSHCAVRKRRPSCQRALLRSALPDLVPGRLWSAYGQAVLPARREDESRGTACHGGQGDWQTELRETGLPSCLVDLKTTLKVAIEVGHHGWSTAAAT
jgi:hypothetical protein